jgi:hypothetical protein
MDHTFWTGQGIVVLAAIWLIFSAKSLAKKNAERGLNVSPTLIRITGIGLIVCAAMRMPKSFRNDDASPSTQQQNPQPVQFTASDGSYSALFPRAPHEQTITEDPNHQPINMRLAAASTTDGAWNYATGCRIYPTGIQPEALIDAVQASITPQYGSPVSTENVVVDGRAGRECLFQTEKAFVRVRWLVEKNRIFTIVIRGRRGQESDSEVRRFLESFHFLRQPD